MSRNGLGFLRFLRAPRAQLQGDSLGSCARRSLRNIRKPRPFRRSVQIFYSDLRNSLGFLRIFRELRLRGNPEKSIFSIFGGKGPNFGGPRPGFAQPTNPPGPPREGFTLPVLGQNLRFCAKIWRFWPIFRGREKGSFRSDPSTATSYSAKSKILRPNLKVEV